MSAEVLPAGHRTVEVDSEFNQRVLAVAASSHAQLLKSFPYCGIAFVATPFEGVHRELDELLGVRPHTQPSCTRWRGSDGRFGLELLVDDHARELDLGTVRIRAKVLGGAFYR